MFDDQIELPKLKKNRLDESVESGVIENSIETSTDATSITNIDMPYRLDLPLKKDPIQDSLAEIPEVKPDSFPSFKQNALMENDAIKSELRDALIPAPLPELPVQEPIEVFPEIEPKLNDDKPIESFSLDMPILDKPLVDGSLKGETLTPTPQDSELKIETLPSINATALGNENEAIKLDEMPNQTIVKDDWIENKPVKKDPTVTILTIIIILATIGAALYFFINKDPDLSFWKTTTTAATTTASQVKPLQGSYKAADNTICPMSVVELIINQNKSFELNDLKFDSRTQSCEARKITGTYTENNGTLVLTSTDNSVINASFLTSTTHAEIQLTNADGIEVLLFREA